MKIKYLPNMLCYGRILGSMLLLFIKPWSISFYIIYLVCGLTDMFDGFIARKTGTASKFGAKLDSLADLFLFAVMAVILFRYIYLAKFLVIWLILIVVLRITAIAIAYKKFKSFVILHTVSNKATGLALFIFPLLAASAIMNIYTYVIFIFASISAAEELIMHIISKTLDRNRLTIFSRFY